MTFFSSPVIGGAGTRPGAASVLVVMLSPRCQLDHRAVALRRLSTTALTLL